jgi:hypothetical protein
VAHWSLWEENLLIDVADFEDDHNVHCQMESLEFTLYNKEQCCSVKLYSGHIPQPYPRRPTETMMASVPTIGLGPETSS